MTGFFKIAEPFNKAFQVTIRVNKEGQFTTMLPEDVTKLLEEREIPVLHNRLGRAGFFSDDTLAGIKQQIVKKIQLLCSEKEISRKRVIRYVIKTTCRYTKTKKGDFVPTIYYTDDLDEDKKADAEGIGGIGTVDIDACRRKTYGFNVYAHVYERIDYEYTATGKKRIEYVSLHEHKFGDGRPDDPIDWLTGITCQSEERSDLMEIDYTHKRGLFFVNLYKAIFKINEAICPFVNPDNIDSLVNNLKLLK